MNKTGHAIGGLSAGIIVINTLSKNNSLNGILFGMSSFYTLSAITVIECSAYLGSLFPDIDHPISTAGKKLKTTSKTIHALYGHRGITHFPAFLAWASFMMYIFYLVLTPSVAIWWMYFCYGFIGGWISHIFLDCFNTDGIRLLAPINQKHFRIPTGIEIKIPRRNKKKTNKTKRKRNDKKTIKFKYKRSSNSSNKFCFLISMISIILCLLM